MPAVTIRNLSEDLHRALKRRAKDHGRSTEAEIRDILKRAVDKDGEVKIGTALQELGQKYGGIELDIARDRTPAKAADFG